MRPIHQRFGFRALLAVPLMREGGAYGCILLWRREHRPFSPDQVALLQTFARQAAIAIDNVRLFNETKDALDQQTGDQRDPARDLELADRRARRCSMRSPSAPRACATRRSRRCT